MFKLIYVKLKTLNYNKDRIHNIFNLRCTKDLNRTLDYVQYECPDS